MTRTTTPPESGNQTPGKDRILETALVAVIALAVVAVIAAGWFGVAWVQAAVNDKQTADTRDAALSGALQAAINLNTLDPADLEGSFDTMRSSLTGDQMIQAMTDTQDEMGAQFKEVGAKGSAEILHGALTEFNEDDGTGTAMVVLETTTTWPDYFERFKVTMRLRLQEVDGVWKASGVDPVGYRIPMETGPLPGAPAPAPAPAEPGAPAPAEPAPAPAEPGLPVPDGTGGQ